MNTQAVSRLFRATINNAVDLRTQVRQALGDNNFFNISPTIPLERLKCAKFDTIATDMYPRLARYLPGETSKNAAERLVAQGYVLGDLGELAQFLAQYPEEVEKFSAVFALDVGSRWLNSEDEWCVAFAGVEGAARWLRHFRFDRPLDKNDCVIVFEIAEHRSLETV